MRALIPLIFILVIAIALLVFYVIDLRRRIAGLDEPELWLPRRERKAHARKLLLREEQQYQDARQQDLLDLINGVKKR